MYPVHIICEPAFHGCCVSMCTGILPVVFVINETVGVFWLNCFHFVMPGLFIACCTVCLWSLLKAV